MKWHIDFSADAVKFLRRNNLEENFVIDKIKLALLKFRGEQINIDIKKLKGDWTGFYRIRVGKLRIMIDLLHNNLSVEISRFWLRLCKNFSTYTLYMPQNFCFASPLKSENFTYENYYARGPIEFQFEYCRAYIEQIDWRSSVYK